jgi:hypothetical protein
VANLAEIIGNKEVALADANAEYAKLWNVLKMLREGELQIDDVTLFTDAAGRLGWKIVRDDELAPDAAPAPGTLRSVIDDRS